METKSYTIRLTPDQEDRMLIHAARHKIHKPTTMVKVLFEEGLALMDGMLKKEKSDK